MRWQDNARSAIKPAASPQRPPCLPASGGLAPAIPSRLAPRLLFTFCSFARDRRTTLKSPCSGRGALHESHGRRAGSQPPGMHGTTHVSPSTEQHSERWFAALHLCIPWSPEALPGVANVLRRGRHSAALRRKRPTLSRDACLHRQRFSRLHCSESGSIGSQARS